ncbi:zinc finger SWIM domain-containing protein 3 [Mytilus galloprovincialis]|uniref:Zinc finger SWIM domain-containing protein 3 n=1 Tax=Mytilus galloprovincialis TaxID=29158 RepID=A0A8B6DA13_MYTGA|nr:zinc finger SWIM domain-containing protein 3 [Mytilus galloprovincialis]
MAVLKLFPAGTFRQHCSSSISFLLSSDGHYLELKSINNGHNHDTSEALFKQLPRERRLPKEMTKEAESLISLKVNKKLLRDHLEQKTGKKVSLKDITNLQTVIKNRSKCHDVASLVKKLLIDHGTIVELFASEDNVLQGLFYQDKEMLQNFENYPEILFIDSTFKVNNLRMPLYVFLVEDSMGQSEIAGLCFLAAEEQQLVDHMGNLFKKFNPSYQKMKMIMADKDFIERETFRSVFPHSSLLICRFQKVHLLLFLTDLQLHKEESAEDDSNEIDFLQTPKRIRSTSSGKFEMKLSGTPTQLLRRKRDREKKQLNKSLSLFDKIAKFANANDDTSYFVMFKKGQEVHFCGSKQYVEKFEDNEALNEFSESMIESREEPLLRKTNKAAAKKNGYQTSFKRKCKHVFPSGIECAVSSK